MKKHLIEKYLTDAMSASQYSKMKGGAADKRAKAKIRKGSPKRQPKISGGRIKESSGAGGSSEIWFGYNRATLIYVQEGEVLFSLNHEFPPGSIMDDETRQRAQARGYVLLDVK